MIVYLRVLIFLSLLGGIFLWLNADLNKAVFLHINGFIPEPSFWLLLTIVGDGLFIGCAFYLIFRRQPGLLLAGLLAGLVTHIATRLLKRSLEVLRPEHVLSDISLLGPVLELTNYSMPSGHTMGIYMAVGFIFQACKLSLSQFVLLNIVGFLVMLSRIAVGAHWPADCLLGLVLGLAIGLAIGKLRLPVVKPWQVNTVIVIYALFSFFALRMAWQYLHPYTGASLFLGAVAVAAGGWLLMDLYNNISKIMPK